MREWNVGQRSIGPGLHKQWHDSQAWIHTLHLPASVGNWSNAHADGDGNNTTQPNSYSNIHPDTNSHCYVYTNTNRYCSSEPNTYSNSASNSYTSAI